MKSTFAVVRTYIYVVAAWRTPWRTTLPCGHFWYVSSTSGTCEVTAVGTPGESDEPNSNYSNIIQILNTHSDWCQSTADNILSRPPDIYVFLVNASLCSTCTYHYLDICIGPFVTILINFTCFVVNIYCMLKTRAVDFLCLLVGTNMQASCSCSEIIKVKPMWMFLCCPNAQTQTVK